LETYRITDLSFTYPNREAPALDGINLSIKRGAFVVIAGPSGCGKTTLLRQLKPSLAPHGAKYGGIYFENTILEELQPRDAAARIGFVLQSPENQIVTDKVWHELAFGLESLGVSTPEIRLRVAEVASFFGMQTWFHRPVTELSGGEKQMLALGSVMAMQPSVLILDEPTSQLDPIAAGEFIQAIGRINRDLGVTVVLTEHRLAEVFPLATKAIVLDKGRVIAQGSPREVGLGLLQRGGQHKGMFLAMPTPMRVWAAATSVRVSLPDKAQDIANIKGTPAIGCPITVREGVDWLTMYVRENIPHGYTSSRSIINTQPNSNPMPSDLITPVASDTPSSPTNPVSSATPTSPPAISLNEVWFRYAKNLPDILKGVSFTASYGEITAILGGNGTGKTTTLGIITGQNKPYRGKVKSHRQVYALPQNPQALFTAKTLYKDLAEIFQGNTTPHDIKTKIDDVTKLCRLDGLLQSHPYDLSGGEMQRAALAKLLLLEPKILLLDEPTKGLDAEYKQEFAKILKKLAAAGVAIVMVSHDIEFCAQHTHRCALFFDGNIITENTPRAFFNRNSFYTTSANKMARHILPDAITVEDIVQSLADIAINKNDAIATSNAAARNAASDTSTDVKTEIIDDAQHSNVARTTPISDTLHLQDMSAHPTINDSHSHITQTTPLPTPPKITPKALKAPNASKAPNPPKLPKPRTKLAAALILLTIPLTIYLGITLLDDRRFYFISMLIILQALLPFALIFESRKPQARELVIIAVLCAIGVAGRAAFFMLPQFKPVIAMVIIAGVALGGETGFLVGATTAFVSNMFFGQGPWTPWQMFAFGIIGFLAGVLFNKKIFNKKMRPAPIALAIFGGIATLIIYGGIMNPAGVIMFQPSPTREMFLLAFMYGLPFDLIHAAATVIFLAIISRPMLEKLDRIKQKYGLY